MATAREAREWARTAIRGIGDSLYTRSAVRMAMTSIGLPTERW